MRRALTLPNERRMFRRLDARPHSGYSLNTMPGGIERSVGIAGQEFQSFTVDITNNGGTLQVRLLGDAIGVSGPGALANRVLAHSPNFDGLGFVNLPTVSSSVDFGRAPVGILSGSTSILVLNCGDQPISNFFGGITRMPLFDANGGTSIRAFSRVERRNVNGRVLERLEWFISNDMTGAAFNINTTNIPSTRRMWLQFFGFIA